MTLTYYGRLAGAAALAVALTGCGGDSAPVAPAPLPTPTPTPPPRVISYQPAWELPSGFYIVADFSIPGAGTVTATVDWLAHGNNVDVYITGSPCLPSLLFSGSKGCQVFDRDERPNAKPAVVTFEAGPKEVGPARIFIVNRGPDAEKGSFIVELQPNP